MEDFCRKYHSKGGVAAHVKEELADQVKLISTSDEASEPTFEAALYELRSGKKHPHPWSLQTTTLKYQ